jgi:hypothetical protein
MAERILGPAGGRRRAKRLIAIATFVGLLVAVTALVTGSSVFAAASTDASVSDYSQCANGKPNATPTPNDPTTCNQGWINGILNANNSQFHEDQVTPQRLNLSVPKGGPATGRTVILKYLDRKGQGGTGNHAYDSMATWNNTVTSADRCLGIPHSFGCPGGNASYHLIPLDPTTVADSNGSGDQTLNHEIADAGTGCDASGDCGTTTGPRRVLMYGGTITGVSTPTHDNASGKGDDYATVTITYSVNGGTSVERHLQLLFGGHLAASNGPRGWGNNVGSSFINGGPYHFKLIQLDNSSIGNRDNQIQSSAILPNGTQVQTALHETDSSGTDVNPANNEDPLTQTGITVNLPSDGSGAWVTDYATVAPSGSTGTVDFRYYTGASALANCQAATNLSEGGTSAGTGKTLTSDVAKSDTIKFTSGGTVYWRAFFQGTGLSLSSSSSCTEEVLTLNQNTSTATTLHQTDSGGTDVVPSNNASKITVPVGSYVTDYASITPSSVSSGTVIFRYYTGSTALADCQADTDGTGGSSGGSGTVSSGSANGSPVQFNSEGTIYWRAFYGGGTNINSSSSSCADEVLTVQKASPQIASDPRLIPQDRATLSGILAGGTGSPTISFYLFGPDNLTCDLTDANHPPVYSETGLSVTGNGDYVTSNSGDPLSTPAGFRLTSASTKGVYHWSIRYSGDSANAADNRDCAESFDFEGITDAAAG